MHFFQAYLPRRRFSQGAIQPIKAILQEIEDEENLKKSRGNNSDHKVEGQAEHDQNCDKDKSETEGKVLVLSVNAE